MSRIGKEPVKVESGVTVTLDGPAVTVKGPKGELSWTLPAGITAEQKDGLLRFARSADDRQSRANHGLARALVANMVEGVSKGYAKQLDIEGVGFKSADYDEMAAKYDPAKLAYGYNTVDGEEVYFIPNPALGLWINRERFS